MCASTLTTRYAMIPTASPVTETEKKVEDESSMERKDKECSPKRPSLPVNVSSTSTIPKGKLTRSISTLKSHGGIKHSITYPVLIAVGQQEMLESKTSALRWISKRGHTHI